MAEPPKKKKKLDIQIIKARHERRVRKTEKAIRKLKKTPKQLKPVEEYRLPPSIMKNLAARMRPTVPVDPNLLKIGRVFTVYKSIEGLREQRELRAILALQDRTLEILRKESEVLYQKAVARDPTLLPFEDNCVVTETPANKDYTPADGVKVDISKVWAM